MAFNPKVSVIIPVYNASNFISASIESLLHQNLEQIEILCIDDGSTDNSIEIINNYIKKDNRIKLLTQSHKGSGAARNMGIRKANGEYIAFMDADDLYPDSDTLNCMYTNAKKHKVYICGGEFALFFNNNAKKLNQDFPESERGYLFEKNQLLDYKNYQFDYGYHRFLYNRQFLIDNDIFFPDYKRFQDPVFFVNALHKAKKFYALDRITYCYRVGHQNINWDYEKVFGVLSGIRDNLKLAYENNFEQLAEFSRIRFFQHFDFLKKALDKRNKSIIKEICILDKTGQIKQFMKNTRKIFYKERCPNGRRHIYFCGIKIFSYQKRVKQ